MPVLRPKVLLKDEYVSQTAYTLDLNLPETGLLSTLWLKVTAKTATTGVCPSPWIKYLISSISVNQAGQNALNAASPEMFQADYYYKTGKMPQRGYQRPGGDGAIIDEIVPIMFSDKVDDPIYRIDLSKLDDPQLSVTYNLAQTDHAAQTIWNTAYYPRFTVMANLIQGVGIPGALGYQSLRSIEGYTPANSQKKMVELKGRRPIKRLYIQNNKLLPNAELLHLVDRFRLWGDNEAWIPFDLEAWPYTELIRQLYGICETEGVVPYAKGGQGVDMAVDRDLGSQVMIKQTNDRVAVLRDNSGRRSVFYLSVPSTGAASTDVLQAEYKIKGLLPWSIGIVDMMKMLGMDTLDPTMHAPVFLELEHAVNAGDYSAPMVIGIEDLASQ